LTILGEYTPSEIIWPPWVSILHKKSFDHPEWVYSIINHLSTLGEYTPSEIIWLPGWVYSIRNHLTTLGEYTPS
jgi:hypothetical protein